MTILFGSRIRWLCLLDNANWGVAMTFHLVWSVTILFLAGRSRWFCLLDHANWAVANDVILFLFGTKNYDVTFCVIIMQKSYWLHPWLLSFWVFFAQFCCIFPLFGAIFKWHRYNTNLLCHPSKKISNQQLKDVMYIDGHIKDFMYIVWSCLIWITLACHMRTMQLRFSMSPCSSKY